MERIEEKWIEELEPKYLENEELTGDNIVLRVVLNYDTDYCGVFDTLEDLQKLFYLNFEDRYNVHMSSFEIPCTTEHDYYSTEQGEYYVVFDTDNYEIVGVYFDEEEANDVANECGGEVYCVGINEVPSYYGVSSYYRNENTNEIVFKRYIDDEENIYIFRDGYWHYEYLEEDEIEKFLENMIEISEDEAYERVKGEI